MQLYPRKQNLDANLQINLGGTKHAIAMADCLKAVGSNFALRSDQCGRLAASVSSLGATQPNLHMWFQHVGSNSLQVNFQSMILIPSYLLCVGDFGCHIINMLVIKIQFRLCIRTSMLVGVGMPSLKLLPWLVIVA